MPFRRKHGTWYWVNQKVIDGAKTRASKKSQFASESVREEDENDPIRDESHINARAYDMTTSASDTKPKVSSTESEASSIHSTESSMQCVETEASSAETKASPIESEAPSTPPNESKMPCVETQELVVAVYLISRSFKTDIIQEVLRRRFCEKHDPDTAAKAWSVLKSGEFHYGKDQYALNYVDLWLNKQTSYEYGNLLFLTKIDDEVRQIAQGAGQNIDEIPHLDVGPIRE